MQIPLIAQQLSQAGLAVFPCRADKGPAVLKGDSWKDYALRPVTENTWPSGVVGVPVPDGVLIVDLDTYKGITRQDVEGVLGTTLEWDRALIQTTMQGGQHYAFRVDREVRQMANHNISGFDTRAADKGYIATGQGYSPANFGLFALTQPQALPPLPEAALQALEVKENTSEPKELPQGDREIDELVSALRFIDPQCSRATWLDVGCGIRHYFHDDETTGEALFDSWSSGALWEDGETMPSNYDETTQSAQFYSFKAQNGDHTKTIASVFGLARQHGYQPPAGFNAASIFGQGAISMDEFCALVDKITAHGADPKHTDSLVKEVVELNCSDLQQATLTATLQRELKEAGLLTKPLRDMLEGSKPKSRAAAPPAPPSGQLTPSNVPIGDLNWADYQTKQGGKPKGTQDNFDIMMDMYGVDVRFNEVSKELTIDGPGAPTDGILKEDAALSYIDHLCNLNDYPKADGRTMLVPTANRNSFNPVTDLLAAVAWDGQDHIRMLFDSMTLHPEENPQDAFELFKRWMIGAVAIGTGQVPSMEYVLVLVDEQGGAGKTRFFCTLAPSELRKDSVTLDTADKDSIKTATSYWLVELGELDGTFTRSEQSRLKSFLSSEKDEIRLPYGRAYMKYPRRTAYFASVNTESFLVDGSGNRRFWPIRVSNVNHKHGVDVLQAWAQAKHALDTGYRWYLNDEENKWVIDRNAAFKSHSKIEDALSSGYDPEAEAERHLSTTEIMREVGVLNPHKSELNEAAQWLRKNGFFEAKRRGKRGFMMPALITVASAAFGQPKVVQGGRK